jgi:hypothetical protein
MNEHITGMKRETYNQQTFDGDEDVPDSQLVVPVLL